MDANQCLEMLRSIKDVAFATVDENGKVCNRIIDVMLVENGKLYFCTSRGKDFYRQLIHNPNVAITGMNTKYQMIRLNGYAKKLENQKIWIDRIFKENPSMNDVYPEKSRYILEPFCMDNGQLEFFDLSQTPIEREYFTLNDTLKVEKGFKITQACVHCKKCEHACPQKCIKNFKIQDCHCLHCGLCYEICPVHAISRK